MYDNHTVAWMIRYPWFRRSSWGRYHAPFVTVWHVDPRGDRGWACGRIDPLRLWRFHVHHWRLQVHPWQNFKRWAFERCEHCKRGARWGYGPISHGKGWVHHECDAAIALKARCGELERALREAFAGYCRVADMEPGEAVDVLLPPWNRLDSGAWLRNYTVRGVLGVARDAADGP